MLARVDNGARLRIEVARAFAPLLKPARYKGARGGRGSGKSHFFGEQLISRCMLMPTRAVCVREVQRTLKHSVKTLLEDKIDALEIREYFHSVEGHIDTPGGGIIIFQGMQNHTAESIKSLENYDIAFVEEAQSLSQRSLTLLRPTIRADNSEMWFAWNPRSPDDPVDAFFRRSPHPQATCVEANWMDNPWFPDVLRSDMEYDRRRDPSRYQHVWLGHYQAHSEARVFTNWRIDEFDTPEDVVFYHGCDWGFSTDPTVLVRCFVDEKILYVDREIWVIGCEVDETPIVFDRLDPAVKGIARRWTIVADSSNPQNISYMRKNGYPKMQPAVKGPGSVEEGVEFLKSYDIVVHPRCRHVADELTNYSYEIDPKTEQVLPRLADRKNHTIDSLRYALEGRRRRANPPMWGSY